MLIPRRPRRVAASFSLAAATALLATSCSTFRADQAPATPQRPTLSSDTNTTHIGTLEYEAGVTFDPNDLVAFPTALKWGASEQTELFLGWPAFLHIERPGDDADGPGSLSVGMRHRFLDEVDDRPSFAAQMVTKLPTASSNEGLDSGEVDFFGAAIATKNFDGLGVTGFYQLGVLGNPGRGGAMLEHDLALAVGGGLDERWGLFGEVGAALTPDTHTEDVRLRCGATYAVGPPMIVDLAVVIGLTNDAPDFQLMLGVTHNLGDLFSAHAARTAR